MKKKVGKKAKKINEITALLDSVLEAKKELRALKNKELQNLSLKEKEAIILIKERIEKQKDGVVWRYEKRKRSLGESLLRRKNEELGKHLSVERKSFNRTSREIRLIRKSRKKLS